MTLYICSYCNRLAVTLWPVTLDRKTLEVCWTCIEEAAGRSVANLVKDARSGSVRIVPSIKSVEIQP